MKEYLSKMKRLKQEFHYRGILSALLGAFVYSMLAFLPIWLILGSITTLYMHRLALMSTFISLTFALFLYVFWYLVGLALKLKKPDHSVDIKYLNLVHLLATESILLIAVIVYFTVIMPRIF